jgi:hypothetical protein
MAAPFQPVMFQHDGEDKIHLQLPNIWACHYSLYSKAMPLAYYEVHTSQAHVAANWTPTSN